METILIIMLCAEIAIFVVVAYDIAIRRPTAAKPRPNWISFGTSLLVVGIASQSIARHRVGTGAELVANIGLVLVGLAIMAVLLAVREGRGVDQPTDS